MTTNASEELGTATVATAEPGHGPDAEVVVPAAEKLSRDEIREVVGAKNVMGTCSAPLRRRGLRKASGRHHGDLARLHHRAARTLVAHRRGAVAVIRP